MGDTIENQSQPVDNGVPLGDTTENPFDSEVQKEHDQSHSTYTRNSEKNKMGVGLGRRKKS